MQVSIDLPDFSCLMNAAEFGIKKAEGYKADYVISAWRGAFERASSIKPDDGRTQEQRDQDAYDAFSRECEKYGCD
jgi:hypothetical protein